MPSPLVRVHEDDQTHMESRRMPAPVPGSGKRQGANLHDGLSDGARCGVLCIDRSFTGCRFSSGTGR